MPLVSDSTAELAYRGHKTKGITTELLEEFDPIAY